MQKHCSGLKGKLENVVDFKCRTCLNQTIANYDDNKFRLRNVDDEVIDQIFYLRDMLSALRVAKASSKSCIRSGWKKSWALLSLLTSRVFSHKTKIKLFSAGVRSIMLYGSKFMPLKKSGIRDCSKRYANGRMDVPCQSKRSEGSRNRVGIAKITDALR